tara:strand:+ start:109 stop:579 length:471 start_codon:yes stop_codon:yes gene_type:complete
VGCPGAPKALFTNPWTGERFPVPRIVPSAYAVSAELKLLVAEVDLTVDKQGRVVRRAIPEALTYMLSRDALAMYPPISAFDALSACLRRFYLVAQIDGARRGKRGFVSLGLKNRYLDSQAALKLLIVGFGTNVVSDNRDGFRCLLGRSGQGVWVVL